MMSDFDLRMRLSVCHEIVDQAVALFRARSATHLPTQTASKSGRRRDKIAEDQGWRCYYCERKIGYDLSKSQRPILEHFVPRHAGRIRTAKRVVVACAFCDKAKGPMFGPEFMEIVRKAMSESKNWDLAAQKIAGRAKTRNRTVLRELACAKVLAAAIAICPVFKRA